MEIFYVDMNSEERIIYHLSNGVTKTLPIRTLLDNWYELSVALFDKNNLFWFFPVSFQFFNIATLYIHFD